jgi:hypothetical protein
MAQFFHYSVIYAADPQEKGGGSASLIFPNGDCSRAIVGLLFLDML